MELKDVAAVVNQKIDKDIWDAAASLGPANVPFPFYDEGLIDVARVRILNQIGIMPPPATRVATLERPKPAPYVLPPVLPNDEYLALAEKLGLQNGPVMKARLERFFVEQGWLVYDYERVVRYLKSLCGPEPQSGRLISRGEYQRPVWIPLRFRNQAKLSGSHFANVTGIEVRMDRTYNDAVPLHALQKIDALQGRFGAESLYFAVSEIERVPDPFLAVGAPGTPFFVIDVWDEPGF